MLVHLAPTSTHLIFLLLGAISCIYMLLSSVIKSRLYLGESNVGLIVGIILGPNVSGLLTPLRWTHANQAILEISRIVISVQTFAVAVELPKYYLEKHWRSLAWILGPVVLWSWMVSGLAVWVMGGYLNWVQSVSIAACFNSIDPVLASTVVTGKFVNGMRVPRHTRDLLLAESASNDITTSLTLGLGTLILRSHQSAAKTTEAFFLYPLLYEVALAALIGTIIGYTARRAQRYAHEHSLIDRESFLSFFLALAILCTGISSMLGIDDVLMSFCAGVSFSNDGWILEKTEEALVSDVLALLFNFNYFIFLGSVIPWDSFHKPSSNILAWRLVIGTLIIFLFRRIPVILMLKPVIPDIRTWREAWFYGHFGPIGGGAIFSAALIIAKSDITGLSSGYLRPYPDDVVVQSVWPIVTFVVLCSSIVHGSSITLLALGKHVQTMSLTMSFSKEKQEAGDWMDRLPQIQARSKSATSSQIVCIESPDSGSQVSAISEASSNQEQEIMPSLSSTSHQKRRGRNELLGSTDPLNIALTDAADKGQGSISGIETGKPAEKATRVLSERIASTDQEVSLHGIEKITLEGPKISDTYEDDHYRTSTQRPQPIAEAESAQGGLLPVPAIGKTGGSLSKLKSLTSKFHHAKREEAAKKEAKRKVGPARAFKFGNTIIVEDEDGEVIKKYELPAAQERKTTYIDPERTKQRLQRMGKWMGASHTESSQIDTSNSNNDREIKSSVRFTVEGDSRRLTKAEFFGKLQSMDPKSRVDFVDQSVVPHADNIMTAERRDRMDRSVDAADMQDDCSNEVGQSTAEGEQRSVEDKSIQRRTSLMRSYDTEETPAERRRREVALGFIESDSDE